MEEGNLLGGVRIGWVLLVFEPWNATAQKMSNMPIHTYKVGMIEWKETTGTGIIQIENEMCENPIEMYEIEIEEMCEKGIEIENAMYAKGTEIGSVIYEIEIGNGTSVIVIENTESRNENIDTGRERIEKKRENIEKKKEITGRGKERLSLNIFPVLLDLKHDFFMTKLTRK